MGTISKLPNAPIDTLPETLCDPDKRVIQKLEELLEEAKRGEIRSFAYAALNDAGCYRTGWQTEAKGYALRQLGALCIITHEIQALCAGDINE